MRLAGWKVALAVLAADVGKGVAVMMVAPKSARPAWAVACVVGHVFSPFLRLGGGKGVAAACGVYGVMFPGIMMGALAVWGVVVGLTGYASLGSLAAVGAAVAGVALTQGLGLGLASISLTALVLVWRHRGNIHRLLVGTEPRVMHRRGGKQA